MYVMQITADLKLAFGTDAAGNPLDDVAVNERESFVMKGGVNHKREQN